MPTLSNRITISGPQGSGKTLLREHLSALFEQKGYRTIPFHTPDSIDAESLIVELTDDDRAVLAGAKSYDNVVARKTAEMKARAKMVFGEAFEITGRPLADLFGEGIELEIVLANGATAPIGGVAIADGETVIDALTRDLPKDTYIRARRGTIAKTDFDPYAKGASEVKDAIEKAQDQVHKLEISVDRIVAEGRAAGWPDVVEHLVVRRVVAELLSQGCELSVYDGEEWTLRKSPHIFEIMAALHTTDADQLRVYHPSFDKAGWISFVYGNEGHEVVSDHSVTEWMVTFLKPAFEFAEAMEPK